MAQDQVGELRRVMQQLFRGFGALAVDTTPCGKPLPMAHAHALMVLLVEGELSQQALGTKLRIDKSNVARLCARMVDAGHAEQRASERDGRSRRVSLTPSGKRLARDVDAASYARFSTWLAALPVARRSPLLDGLNQLVAAMDVLLTRPVDEMAAK